MAWNKSSGKQFMVTKFRNGGRIAGTGIACDDYSEESFGRGRVRDHVDVRFTTDGKDPKSLNGPVIIVQEGRKKDGK